MRPIYFNDCFGWLHMATGRRGVVLCNPHGYEEQSVHRIWRGLACRLAAAGLPTLRFDYPGTGDSAGSDADPARVAVWLDSVRAAIRCLREQTGVEEVALVGLRLGALLAPVVAQDGEDIAAMVLMAPLLSGQAYTRQMKVLARMAATPLGAPPPDIGQENDIEMGGCLLTSETTAALGQINMLALARAPAPRVLLLDRPDVPVGAQLAARWQALGAEVRVEPLVGYRDMIRNAAHLAQAPHQVLAFLTDWLAEGVTPLPVATPPSIQPLRLVLPDAIETPVFFGRNDTLFGIESTPIRAAVAATRPAVLFLNTGANNHIGANRLTVKLARDFAASGFASLRIDVAGIGDSNAWPGTPDNLTDSIGSCADVRAAIDWLEERGYRQCVVVGLCSGAHLAFNSAFLDSRISGMVLVNPQLFVFTEQDNLSLFKRWLQQAWQGMLRSKISLAPYTPKSLRRIFKRTAAKVAKNGELSTLFGRLANRGVETLLVYSGDDIGLDVLEIHLGPRAKIQDNHRNIRLEIIAGADHTMAKRWARDYLAAVLARFLLSTAPPVEVQHCQTVVRSH